MMKKPNCPVIAIEEHYWDPELAKHFTGPEAGRGNETDQRLFDLGSLRLKEMDEAGIDVQVLSHGAPSTQKLGADIAADLTRQVNDRLAKVCAANPKRFAAFAALPTVDPKAAADELERTVTKLGFKGAMLHGMSNGEFLDLKKFWPIYERAEKLDVPIYFHPSLPHAKVTEIYYQDYAKDFPLVVRPAWGYTVETATQAIRLVLSGVFDAHPNLKIILGHFGETLPFLLWRIDSSLKRPGPESDELPRHLLQELLCDHQRLLFRSGADLLRAGDGRRSHPVRGRLAVRDEPAGGRMDAERADIGRGQGEDPERKRQAPAEDVIRRSGAGGSSRHRRRTASTLYCCAIRHGAPACRRRSVPGIATCAPGRSHIRAPRRAGAQ